MDTESWYKRKLESFENDEEFKLLCSELLEAELGRLAEKVVAQKAERENEDVEAWAERLANQCAEYTD